MTLWGTKNETKANAQISTFQTTYCWHLVAHVNAKSFIKEPIHPGIQRHDKNREECCFSALCSSYPHVKVSIRDLSQISTTAPIFKQSHYFRQKYLEIASFPVSLLNIFGYELNTIYGSSKIYKKSIAVQAVCRQDVNKIVWTSWTLASKQDQIFYMVKK